MSLTKLSLAGIPDGDGKKIDNLFYSVMTLGSETQLVILKRSPFFLEGEKRGVPSLPPSSVPTRIFLPIMFFALKLQVSIWEMGS
jgi:hypothetical protein